eukprot:CAMPEP_0178427814 /NCGR_PEP_ID=MMETSP0689_2-20121128/29940_1 /TAXON_ID=160604 /ORGANISM="Amphidinium massartii, Strain CS-259" /LENGTH=410 /DNA_ID=CAMNT_0020049535 /DNA_START=118 /DNA_END=1350 /DNA_ORIENTATION=-
MAGADQGNGTPSESLAGSLASDDRRGRGRGGPPRRRARARRRRWVEAGLQGQQPAPLQFQERRPALLPTTQRRPSTASVTSMAAEADAAAHASASAGASAAAAADEAVQEEQAAKTLRTDLTEADRSALPVSEALVHAMDMVDRGTRERALEKFSDESRVSISKRKGLLREWVGSAHSQLGESLITELASAYIVLNALKLARIESGSRLLYAVLSQANNDEFKRQIVEVLSPHCEELVESPSGNHVVGKLLEVLPITKMHKICEYLVNACPKLTQRQYGCRVLQRLIEHCDQGLMRRLSAKLLPNLMTHCNHRFGNYVLQHVFQFGSTEICDSLAVQLMDSWVELARNQYGTWVVQKAMECVELSDELKATIFQILTDGDQDGQLSKDRWASFAIRQMKHEQRRFGHVRA